MMNLKFRNVVLGVISLLLAVPTILQLRSEADTFVDVSRIPLMFAGFTSDNVGSILLALPKEIQPEPPANPNPNQPQQDAVAYDQLLLKLTDSGWRIGDVPGQASSQLAGAPVMKPRVEADVFLHLRLIRNDPETLVQSNATDEQLAKYGLDEQHAYLIRVGDKTGKTIVAELYVGDDSSIGQTGPDAVRGVFVRQKGSNDVVLYEWQKPWRRSIEASQWVDRLLMRVDPSKVRSFTIKNASTKGKTFAFEREPGKAMWGAKGGAENLGALRQTEIEGLIQRFRYLSVAAFERPISRAGDMAALGLFPSAAIEISFTVEEDAGPRTVKLAVGGRVEGRNEYYLTSNTLPFLMTWPASMVTNFELDVAQRLFDPKPGDKK
jgi:hypothetical protein